MMLFSWLLVSFLLLLLYRFVLIIRGQPASAWRRSNAPASVCVVLGSGGHTSEMMRAIRTLSPDPWRASCPFYVVSATDTHSAALAAEYEEDNFHRRCRLYTIPRAREVGQSYFFSIFSTLWAFCASLRLIITEKPDIVLVNGPGVCVPVVVAGLFVALFSPPCYYRRPAIAFMESYTCVKHLSLSGKLLAPFCDVFVVQWQFLYGECRRKWWGKNVSFFFVGTMQSLENVRLPFTQNQTDTLECKTELFALVTVGSTRFDSLMEAVDCESVFEALAKRNITRLLVQKGTSHYQMRITSAYGVTAEVFAYRPRLHEIVRDAALVISHAGAGTILEALEHKRPLVVVPNRALMSDHQLELADALSAERYLFCVHVRDVASKLHTLDFGTLRVYPGINTVDLRNAILRTFVF